MKKIKKLFKEIVYNLVNFVKPTYVLSEVSQKPCETFVVKRAELHISAQKTEYLKFQKLLPYSGADVSMMKNVCLEIFTDVIVDLDNGIALNKKFQIVKETKKYQTMKVGTHLSKVRDYEEIEDEYVIVINGALNSQYFHIWFDSLVKLYYLNEIKQKPVIVLWNSVPRIYKEVIYSFNDVFTIKEVSSKFIKVKKYCVLRNVYWAKHAPYINTEIRDFFVGKLAAKTGELFPAKVYIKRRTRPVVNEYEVEKLFVDKGFEIIYLEDLNIFEQAKLFNNAIAVAGLHGAGFTNLIFASSKLRVIELQNFAIVPTYYFISQQLGLDFYYILPDQFDFDKICDPYLESKMFYEQKLKDVSFNIQVLEEVIEKALLD